MLFKTIAVVLGVLAASVGAAFAFVPPLRNGASALLHAPERNPGLASDPRVRFEPGAQDCAAAVAALLPAAVARVESAQKRRFVSGPTVGVYATDAAYAAANGAGNTGPAGVSFDGRLTLAPKMCNAERDRLPAVLTHELSHVNLQQNLSLLAYLQTPSWFKEGLAVAVSDGGGAEGVTQQQARAAIAAGVRIVVADSGSLFSLVGVRFETPPQLSDLRAARLAYRQAGLFVQGLQTDRPAFDALLQGLYAGDSFASAFRAAYGATASSKWREFVSP